MSKKRCHLIGIADQQLWHRIAPRLLIDFTNLLTMRWGQKVAHHTAGLRIIFPTVLPTTHHERGIRRSRSLSLSQSRCRSRSSAIGTSAPLASLFRTCSSISPTTFTIPCTTSSERPFAFGSGRKPSIRSSMYLFSLIPSFPDQCAIHCASAGDIRMVFLIVGEFVSVTSLGIPHLTCKALGVAYPAVAKITSFILQKSQSERAKQRDLS